MSNKKDNSYRILVAVLSVLCVLLLIASAVLVVKTVQQRRGKTPEPDSSSGQSQSSSEPSGEPYKVSTAKIGSAGDILVHNPVLKAAYSSSSGEYDFNNIYDEIEDTINGCDYFVANLEVTLGGSSKKYSGYPVFNCPDSMVDAAKNAGIDCLLTANNHSYDTGKNGFLRTQEVIDKKQLDRVGSRLEESDKRYLVKEVNGISFGFICYTYETVAQQSGRKALNGILMTEDTQDLINSFSYEKLDSFYEEIEDQLSKMKSDGAEVLTVYMHWGDEYNLTGNSWQKQIAQKLCDMGVDVIIGGHPHVVEPMELLESSDGGHKTVCVYSVGNFVSNQRREYMNLNTGHTEDGLVFTMTFSKYSDGTVEFEDIEAIPTWVHLYTEGGSKVYSIVPLNGDFKDDAADLGLTKTSNGVSMAEASYKRTDKIISDGYEECLEFVHEDERSAQPDAA